MNTKLKVTSRAQHGPALLTKEELAKVIGMKVRGVQNLTQRAVIPVLKISHRCVRYDVTKVLAALARYEVPEVGRPR